MKLVDYIFGSRRGQEANSLEKDAMTDPFLADAMEGYDVVYDNHHDILNELRQKVPVRAAKMSHRLPTSNLLGRKLYFIAGAAAAVLLVVSVVLISVLRTPAVEGEMIAVSILPDNDEFSEGIISSGIALAEVDESVQEEIVEMPATPITVIDKAKTVGSETGEEKVVVKDNFATRGATQDKKVVVADNDISDAIVDRNAAALRTRSVAASSVSAESVSADMSVGQFAEAINGLDAEDSGKNIRVVRNANFEKYFASNRRTLKSAGGGVTGSVVVEFRVNDAGVPTSIRVLSGISKDANRKVIELLVSGPVWEPTAGERVRTVLNY